MIIRTPHAHLMSMKHLLACVTLLVAAPVVMADDAVETPGALAQNSIAPTNPPSGPAHSSSGHCSACQCDAGSGCSSSSRGSACARRFNHHDNHNRLRPVLPDPARTNIAQIRREEIVRRQELVYRADQAMADGRKAETGLNYPEARKQYLFAVEAYGTVSRSTQSYSTAAEGLTRVDFKLYDDACAVGDTARAKLLVEEVLKYNPNNPEAARRMAAIDRALNNPNDTSILGNPAVTPKFVDKVNHVQELFAEAEQFRRTGQWGPGHRAPA